MSKKHGEWIDSLSGKNSDLEKRYGVSGVRMSKPGSETWEEDTRNRENYRKNMQEGARNDYDTRRTLEAAAAMSLAKRKHRTFLTVALKTSVTFVTRRTSLRRLLSVMDKAVLLIAPLITWA